MGLRSLLDPQICFPNINLKILGIGIAYYCLLPIGLPIAYWRPMEVIARNLNCLQKTNTDILPRAQLGGYRWGIRMGQNIFLAKARAYWFHKGITGAYWLHKGITEAIGNSNTLYYGFGIFSDFSMF